MSDNPDETAYYLRLLSMFMDLGTETVLEVFVFHSPGRNAEAFLRSKEQTLIKMMRDRILNRQECDLLFQKDKTRDIYKLKGIVDLKRFDISLIITLSINLFDENQLTPPQKGWENPPRNSDTSIAADLLRLRTTRNVIVGHYPKAQLAKWCFDEKWEEVSNIILRIRQQLQPGNEIVWKERINSYRLQTLDPTVTNMYDGKLRVWHEEVSEVQDQVEDLLKKLEGFDAYFHNKCDRYERYIKLLVQGGGFVMAALIKEQTKRQGRDLRKMLDENEDTIKAKISDVNDLAVLYPSQTSSDVQTLNTLSSLNVSALETVILQVFGEAIGEATEWAVRTIGNAYRNYAENALVALDSNTFEDFSSDLKASLRIVSEKLNKDQAKEYYRILEECKKKITENEFRTYVDELRTQGKHIRTFTDIFKETLKKTKEFLQDMVTRGISFKYSHELDLKMITLGTSEEKKQLAENILTEIWLEAVNRSVQNSVQDPEFADVKKKVEHILDEIRKSKSVTSITVTQSCIIVKIACTSPSDMLDMINYFESSEFHKSLNIISKELGYHFNTAFAIKAFIPVDSLWGIQNHQDDVAIMKEEGIRVPISVSSPAGMLQLRSLFNSEKIANSTNSIADALSKHFNEQITLKVETDMREFTKIFDEDMAVSGRKGGDFRGSVSLGSTEDFDHSCELCLTVGQHVEAHGFCVDCQEYLCKTCYECHKRPKASRNHKLLDKDDIHKQVFTSKNCEECTEKCSVHTKEIIKFFCSTHEALGCNDCIIMDHRTCYIEYIPDKCAGVGESQEYKDTVEKLNEKMEEAKKVINKAKIRVTEIDTCHAGVIKRITDFRKEINDRFDQLQQEIQKIADKKKSNDKQLIQNVLDECSGISSYIKSMQSNLKANKISRQNGQLFINIKRAISKLNSDEIKKANEKLLKTDMQYTFKRNTDLEKLLFKGNVFGELDLTASLATPLKKKTFDNLTQKEDIDVRTKSDKTHCLIKGNAVLSSNKLVLADCGNSKLKIIDTQSKALIEEKTLDSGPWDITAIPRGQIAVTMPDKKKILIMSTSGHLSDVRSIPVKGKCYGITYHQGYLYVVCSDTKSVHVLDTQGNVQNTISLNNDIFQYPLYIVVSEDCKRIYISEEGSHSVVSITLQGAVSAVYKHKDLNGPGGMLMLDDGSLLVCSSLNGSIRHISADLKQRQTVVDGIKYPLSMSYNHHDEELYIGCYGNMLKVFRVN